MRSRPALLCFCLCLGLAAAVSGASRADDPGAVEVRVPIDGAGRVDAADLIERLAGAVGLRVSRPPSLLLPVEGLAGALTRTMLGETLGPRASFSLRAGELVVALEVDPEGPAAWARRLNALAERAGREAGRRTRYGMHALRSYRPDDPERRTVLLVHGLNSTSGSFVHMIPIFERAGFGVVVYDFPDNQDLDRTAPEFVRDLEAFRERTGDRRPWAIVTHSMGALLARYYVEGPDYGGDVSDLILIGPPNRGSSVARVQALVQLLEGVRSVRGERAGIGALASMGEGLGESADDLLPGSAFLRAMDARPRREGVNYRILAGSGGFVTAEGRRDLESRLGMATRAGGFLGGMARLALGDLPSQLDELCEGTGDGCVSVASCRLEGAPEPVVIPANHVELIRGPLLYPDPGPVACMPYVLRWLGVPEPSGR